VVATVAMCSAAFATHGVVEECGCFLSTARDGTGKAHDERKTQNVKVDMNKQQQQR